MAKYDGLIIPRSYNDYINKSDPAGVAQALQLTGVMDNAPTAQSTKPAKSGGIFAANAVIMANNKTLSGVAISAGSVVRVLFTAALTGSDATTGLTLTYNGTEYAVKAGKDGALVALTAHLIEESFVYLQAYTTLELAFDGSQFVVMGNPVVISNADFSIMADGSITYTNKIRQLTIADISYDSNKFQIDTDYTRLYYNDYQFWGVLWFTTLQNIGAWGSQITFTKLKNIFKMKYQFLRSALGDNTMISVEDFTTTSNTISANTTIGLFFSIGIEHK